MKTVLTILMLGSVFLMFRTLNGLAAGSALLVTMGAIKLLETGDRRDHFITIGAALFLLLAACLERQSLLRMPLYLAHAWVCCSAMVVVAHPRSALNNRGATLLAARSLLFALPLALLLFLFFPRLSGSFWAFSKTDSATTGLSETMSPGSISELTESDAPAFRVWFIGRVPPPHERYWRGPVLHDFDGYTWTRPRNRDSLYLQEHLDGIGIAYQYRIAMEPHSEAWWFSLDTVTTPPRRRRVSVTYDHQLLGIEPVTELTTYEAISHTQTRTLDPLSVLTKRYDTALPPGRNLKSRRLATNLRQRAATQAVFVRNVLNLFRTGGFEYTLTPPLLDLDSVDDFIFNTKRGFCGHYASAFVTLMRAGGVPARVVTGYLGGEWNPIGKYFLVKQSDAHAWAEIWVDQRGWVRVDPTGVVAPERLERGILDLLPNAVSAQARLIHDVEWLTNLGQAWDALNAWWNAKVVGFDLQSQLSILDGLGFEEPGWQQLGWTFAGALAAWMLWMTVQLGRAPQGPKPDRVARAYQKLCAKLAAAGLSREPHLGPLAFADSIRAQRPDLSESIAPLLTDYAALRFGPVTTSADITTFERAVSRFRIP
jgi:transglutaminase-like putative cysteine protease